jgi:hypothetical protein
MPNSKQLMGLCFILASFPATDAKHYEYSIVKSRANKILVDTLL